MFANNENMQNLLQSGDVIMILILNKIKLEKNILQKLAIEIEKLKIHINFILKVYNF